MNRRRYERHTESWRPPQALVEIVAKAAAEIDSNDKEDDKILEALDAQGILNDNERSVLVRTVRKQLKKDREERDLWMIEQARRHGIKDPEIGTNQHDDDEPSV